MNVNAMFIPVALHRVPIFGHFGLRFRKLIPSHRGTAWGQFHHFNAVLHRTDVVAKAAAHAIFFAYTRLRTRRDRFLFTVRMNIIGARLDFSSVARDEINALMSGIVARHIAEIAFDAFGRIDARTARKDRSKFLKSEICGKLFPRTSAMVAKS